MGDEFLKPTGIDFKKNEILCDRLGLVSNKMTLNKTEKWIEPIDT